MNKTRKLASKVPCFVGNTVTLNIFIFNKRYLIKDISWIGNFIDQTFHRSDIS